MRILTFLSQDGKYRRADGRGFTLLEAVVTIAILAIIASSLTIVFRTLLGSWNKLEATGDVSQSAYATLEQISRELRNAVKDTNNYFYLIGIDKDDTSNHIAETNSDEIYFVSAINGTSGTGLAEVGYWLNDKAVNKDNSLMRHVKENAAGQVDFKTSVGLSSSSMIATNVTGFEIMFWGPSTTSWTVSSPAQATDALTSWDSRNPTNALPVAVKIVIKMTDDKNKNEASFEKTIFLNIA